MNYIAEAQRFLQHAWGQVIAIDTETQGLSSDGEQCDSRFLDTKPEYVLGVTVSFMFNGKPWDHYFPLNHVTIGNFQDDNSPQEFVVLEVI